MNDLLLGEWKVNSNECVAMIKESDYKKKKRISSHNKVSST